jgi:hypothetical protein
MTSDHRAAALAKVNELIALLKAHGPHDALLEEAEALARAIAAFHMEGIRFRIYNVDRVIHKGAVEMPASASAILEEARRHLEAAGFHTRSHQAPG